MIQFNTHEVFKQLVETGMKDKTAEKLVEVINQYRLTDFENLVTKQDLKIEIADVKSALKDEITELKIKLNRIDDNIVLIKWFSLGILFPVIAATFKFLIFPMFSN